jgi:predicted nucleic acid-binding protein
MKFWDPSALVPALVDEPATAAVHAVLRVDASITVAWHCEIECASAIARLERTGAYSSDDADAAFRQLAEMQSSWTVVHPTDRLRTTATRLLRVHDLRAADALQLASAIAAAEGHPASLEFVSLDDRLNGAARREGFPLVVPQPE